MEISAPGRIVKKGGVTIIPSEALAESRDLVHIRIQSMFRTGSSGTISARSLDSAYASLGMMDLALFQQPLSNRLLFLIHDSADLEISAPGRERMTILLRLA